MTTRREGSGTAVQRGLWSGIKNRHLDHYPSTGPRIGHLVLVVGITIMLYYELYVVGSVSTLVLPDLNMSFTFFVYTLAFGNLAGAFGSLAAGLADRIGRTQLIVVGLLLTGLLTAFVIPAMSTKWPFAIATFAVGVVEGVVLVVTPALIRDFSPQLGRASAMGFWTIGPVLGSLAVSAVGTLVIDENTQWQTLFRICGLIGLVVFVIAFLFLRELAPGIRNQLMVSERDRMLVEAKAEGVDVEASLRHPFRQLLTPGILLSALAVSVLLVWYYTAVAFGTVIYQTIFAFDLNDANGLANWGWAADAVALVAAGVLSDRVRVRKPFMIFGGVGTAVMMVVFLSQFGQNPSYSELATVIAVLTVFLAFGYAPWMASFTETVEARNPGLSATGLAIWGWIQRIVVFASFALVPVVVTGMTPLVNYGAEVSTLSTQYQSELATSAAIEPQTLAAISADSNDRAAQQQAVAQIVAAEDVTPEQAVTELTALGEVPPEALSFLDEHGADVQNAAEEAPGQWRNWYWICFGATIFFILCVPLLDGRWNPKAARKDAEEHAKRVEEELAARQDAISGGSSQTRV